MNDALVLIENVSKTFDKGQIVALKSMNFVIKSASFTGIVGPDGAGKTTMIRIMSGLMYPDEGRVIMGGIDIHKDNSGLYDKIGYMPQKFGLYEDLTVMENLKLYAGVRGIEKAKQKSVFDELLHFTALGPFTGRLTGRLSGGMKQKLGLACVLMSRPKLLLLDEPSVGVDPISRRELWKMTAELTKTGVGVVWSTSYLDEAEKCQDIILLNNGTILYDGKPHDMVKECENRAFHVISSKEDKRSVLARLLERENVIDGLIQGNKIRVVTNKPGFKTADLDDANLKVVATEPRFEDAFVSRLGGCPKGGSLLAASIKEVAIKDKVVIECFDLTKKFGNFTAADKISFKINKGEVFGFLGPNGAGKSTTFRMLCGLLKPTSGSGKVVGYAMQHQGQELRSNIGYMAQKFSLYNNLTVKQNLQFFSGIYGLRGHRQQEAIQKMTEIFNFEPILNNATKSLSLGFRQRLALACAVMHNPPILFLDEPTSGVDPIMRREFWLHINGMVQKGITIMVSTHFMEEAEYCDRIALIYQGKKIAEGSPDELKEFAHSDANPRPNMEEAFIALINKMNAQ